MSGGRRTQQAPCCKCITFRVIYTHRPRGTMGVTMIVEAKAHAAPGPTNKRDGCRCTFYLVIYKRKTPPPLRCWGLRRVVVSQSLLMLHANQTRYIDFPPGQAQASPTIVIFASRSGDACCCIIRFEGVGVVSPLTRYRFSQDR